MSFLWVYGVCWVAREEVSGSGGFLGLSLRIF